MLILSDVFENTYGIFFPRDLKLLMNTQNEIVKIMKIILHVFVFIMQIPLKKVRINHFCLHMSIINKHG